MNAWRCRGVSKRPRRKTLNSSLVPAPQQTFANFFFLPYTTSCFLVDKPHVCAWRVRITTGDYVQSGNCEHELSLTAPVLPLIYFSFKFPFKLPFCNTRARRRSPAKLAHYTSEKKLTSQEEYVKEAGTSMGMPSCAASVNKCTMRTQVN